MSTFKKWLQVREVMTPQVPMAPQAVVPQQYPMTAPQAPGMNTPQAQAAQQRNVQNTTTPQAQLNAKQMMDMNNMLQRMQKQMQQMGAHIGLKTQ